MRRRAFGGSRGLRLKSERSIGQVRPTGRNWRKLRKKALFWIMGTVATAVIIPTLASMVTLDIQQALSPSPIFASETHPVSNAVPGGRGLPYDETLFVSNEDFFHRDSADLQFVLGLPPGCSIDRTTIQESPAGLIDVKRARLSQYWAEKDLFTIDRLRTHERVAIQLRGTCTGTEIPKLEICMHGKLCFMVPPTTSRSRALWFIGKLSPSPEAEILLRGNTTCATGAFYRTHASGSTDPFNRAASEAQPAIQITVLQLPAANDYQEQPNLVHGGDSPDGNEILDLPDDVAVPSNFGKGWFHPPSSPGAIAILCNVDPQKGMETEMLLTIEISDRNNTPAQTEAYSASHGQFATIDGITGYGSEDCLTSPIKKLPPSLPASVDRSQSNERFNLEVADCNDEGLDQCTDGCGLTLDADKLSHQDTRGTTTSFDLWNPESFQKQLRIAEEFPSPFFIPRDEATSSYQIVLAQNPGHRFLSASRPVHDEWVLLEPLRRRIVTASVHSGSTPNGVISAKAESHVPSVTRVLRDGIMSPPAARAAPKQ
jgi:hypothetical protein